MKINGLNGYIIFLLILFSSRSYAKYGEDVSIYSIANGTLIYSYEYSNDEYVSADYAYELKGRWIKTANWKTFHTSDGYIMLQNAYSSNCLTFYGKGYQAIEKKCDVNDENQKIKPVLVSTGAVQLTYPLVKDEDICLYNHAGDSSFYVYTDSCSIKKKYLWSLVPILSDAEES
ncbi:hypothetical protein HJ107_24420 [Vibrio parahaemolyticus]|nr:hypothetical protein [Vibrio parahaemolyticus]ELA7521212.1 hypothetical protein [Vibrio parahaemolyticus]ELC0683305.1 hypothetical protein [Vibrio parahaemolyticus]MBE4089901.1 hypothetical protein [Vibrio parahaemolyticus]